MIDTQNDSVHMRRFRFPAMAFVLLLWLAGCQRSPYPILDSEYWIEDLMLTFPTFYWIDNDRVIFTGAPYGQILENQKRGELFRAAVNIWDTKKQVVTQVAQRGSGLCYHNNYLRYSYESGDGPPESRQPMIGEGTLDRVTERPSKELPRDAQLYTVRNWFTCRDFDMRQLPGYGDRMRRIPLREGHGYLEAGEKDLRTPEMPLRLFPPGHPEGIELPLQEWQMSDRSITYLAFENVYLLYNRRPQLPGIGTTTWPKNLSYPLHFLSPNGKVRTVEVPYIERMSGGASFYPVRSGIVASVGDHPKHKATYLVRANGERIKLPIAGFIITAVASPDGCKLAFHHDEDGWLGSSKPPQLKMINFCN